MAALTIELPTMTISGDERRFFAGLGERVQRAVMDVIDALLARQGS